MCFHFSETFPRGTHLETVLDVKCDRLMAIMPPFFELGQLIWSFKKCLPIYDQFAQKLRAIFLKYNVPPPVIFTLSILGKLFHLREPTAHVRCNFNFNPAIDFDIQLSHLHHASELTLSLVAISADYVAGGNVSKSDSLSA